MPIRNVKQFRQWQPPYRPDAIIEDGLLLPETALFMFGSAKSWKTWHSLHLAYTITSGTPWFGYEVKRATVFRYQVELTEYIDKDRTFGYLKNRTPENLFFKTPDDNIFLDTTFGKQSLEHDILEVKKRTPYPDEPLVVILDPIYLLMSGDPSDGQDTKKVLINLRELRPKHHVTFIIVHHARLAKTDGQGKEIDMGFEEIMGSSYWGNFCDTMLRTRLMNPYSGANRTQLSFLLHRNAKHFHPAFITEWDRNTLVPEVIQRDIVEDEEASVRNLIGDEE